jgi:hypothetical protein
VRPHHRNPIHFQNRGLGLTPAPQRNLILRFRVNANKRGQSSSSLSRIPTPTTLEVIENIECQPDNGGYDNYESEDGNHEEKDFFAGVVASYFITQRLKKQ